MSELKYRNELKFLLTNEQYVELNNRAKYLLNCDSHTNPDGYYMIRSIYFDDYYNSCFYENESGIDPREKFRIRIYNNSKDRITLELKKRTRNKTCKLSQLIDYDFVDNIINGNQKNFATYSYDSSVFKQFISQRTTNLLEPKVIVDYKRYPYVYKCGNVRITFDTEIASSPNISSFFCDNIQKRLVLPTGAAIMEVKYDEYLPLHIQSLLQIGELSQISFSKYYLCRKYCL